ncbi:MAG: hypothetical protein IJZ89_08975 [Clostridia bacterium]|nr:hypothetical protein [Clostridia bacterium]
MYTDENGRFSFEKPFGTCFCEINLETLPLGYGISKSNIYVPRERISDEIKLSRITDVDISPEGEEIRVRFLDSADYEVNVQYKIVPYDSEPMELGCEDLKSITSYTYGGEVVTAWNSFEYSFTKDISEYSSIEKLNYLSNKGIIEGKNTYYSLLLDLLSDGEEDNIECGTGFYLELFEYSEVCDDPILKTRIYKILGMEQEEPDNNTEETKAFETKEIFILSAVLFLLATMGVCIIIFKCKRR